MAKIKISDITITKIKNNELVKELPEIYQLKEVIENNDWHNHESVFDHTLTVLRELKKIIRDGSPKIKKEFNKRLDYYRRKDLLFLAVLFHDIGKKATLRKINDITSSSAHEKEGAKKVKKILDKFDLSEKEKRIVRKIVRNHGLISIIVDPKNNNLSQEFKKFKSSYSDILLELILLAIADTIKSYLRIAKPKEFEFRMNFYNNEKIIET
jgi:putative nucleotidyltransferase with HDIG domain